MPYATKRWRPAQGERFWYVDCDGIVRMARPGAQTVKSPYVLVVTGQPEPEPPEPEEPDEPDEPDE
jgi:hypothetical protein